MSILQFPRSATDPARPATAGEPIMCDTLHELLTAYSEEHLKGKPSYRRQLNAMKPWLLTLTTVPTRHEIMTRHKLKGHGHFEPGASGANMELALLRSACRWGLYHERWHGGDPTVGVKKWKTAKREEVLKYEQITTLLTYFERAQSDLEIRDRALFGLMLFTGCRPGEARKALLASITPYREMGCWKKGLTKNKKKYEVPVPSQYMPWLAAWLAIRPSARPSPYLFPGSDFGAPFTDAMVGHRWHDLRLMLGLHGLWNYDLRRSLATHMSNELNYSDAKVDAILGHAKPTSLGHYLHVSFDAMCEPIQHYADWLWALRQEPKGERQDPVFVSERQAVAIPATPPPVIAPCRATDDEEKKRLHSLSEREYEVLASIAQGQSCTAAAMRLVLSIKTVYTYRARLLRKLHLSTTAALIRFAIRHEADRLVPAPAQPTPAPVIAPAVVSQTMPPPMPIANQSQSVEREEWPG